MIESDCIFCGIAQGNIPAEVFLETDQLVGFMDINPLSPGHCLFIPKSHAEKAHEVDDEVLREILVSIKRVTKALELENYNVLQNNGSIAHQAVKHAHWHLIPKPERSNGLIMEWKPLQGIDQESIAQTISEKI